MTPERLQKLENVLKHRQDNLTVVMENVDDPHNISAVMRTCEAVGVQDIYILTTRIKPHKRFGNRSSSSAAKWLTIHVYTDMDACIRALRENYRQILTTHLGEKSQSLYELDLTQPTALVFGNEHDGVSAEMRAIADGNFIIPQVGIIQSLNISVACAVSLYEAYRQKERAGHYARTQLSPERYTELFSEWGAGPDEITFDGE
jgi:tRNA (guanosine-2'-O-)-methyltransferase